MMTFDLNLPPMRSNPFSSRPIESYDWRFLAGRGKLVAKMVRHLKFDSPRLILLKGERGSGRTSLIHALASQAGRFDSFSIFPHDDHSRRILEETYTSIVGFEIPSHYGQLVSQLVEELNANTGTLPLVAYDFPGASGADLVAVFSRLTPVLQRLRALVIISVTPSQLAAFPDELKEGFDEIEELQPLSRDGIEELVRRRIDTVSRRPWTIPPDLITSLHDETGGHIGRVVRYLRDIIDVERGEKVLDQRLENLLSAMSAYRESSTSDMDEDEVDGEYHEGADSEPDEVTIEQAIEGISKVSLSDDDAAEGAASASESASEFESASDTDADSAAESKEDESTAVKSRIRGTLEDGEEPPSTFSFTIDRIADDCGGEAMYLDSDSPSVSGIFGGLAQRNRVAKNIVPRYDPELNPLPDHAFASTSPTMSTEGAELWLEDSDGGAELSALPPAVDEPQPFVQQNPSTTPSSYPTIPQPMRNRENPAVMNSPHVENHPEQHQDPPFESGLGEETMLSAQIAESMAAVGDQRLIASRLSALNRRAQTSPHESVALNIAHLRALSAHESQVIARATGGEFSPSDEDLLIRLNIGRSRMSQICNALYRSGIMRVRKVERSRMFSLTNDAKVQLQVWGILEEG